jgi:hypothetical protein
MKNHLIVAKLARHAVATAIVTSSVIPSNQATATAMHPIVAQGSAFPNHPVPPEIEQSSSTGYFVLTLTQQPSVWDKKLEREFRSLALAEATATISLQAGRRLEQLSHWRDRLLNPQTTDEILLQIRRDSLLERINSLLNEYVEFQESADQKRTGQ